MSLNYCDCPNPPGGRIQCNEFQLAICEVINGTAAGRCHDIPTDVLTDSHYLNWVWSVVTGSGRRLDQRIGVDVRRTIMLGAYEGIRFKLPTPNSRGMSGEADVIIGPSIGADGVAQAVRNFAPYTLRYSFSANDHIIRGKLSRDRSPIVTAAVASSRRIEHGLQFSLKNLRGQTVFETKAIDLLLWERWDSEYSFEFRMPAWTTNAERRLVPTLF